MFIDENRINVLTKYASKKGRKKNKTSDHNILVSKFSIQVEAKPRSVRAELKTVRTRKSSSKKLQAQPSCPRVLIKTDLFLIMQMYSLKI
jgi:hypothetical protein